MRSNKRLNNELRPLKITRNYTNYAEGSVLVESGNTKVICNVSYTKGVPRFLKDSGQGWITAEYGMLPRATHTRSDRESSKGKQTGRTLEIQRLIGRSLRQVIDLKLLGENTLYVDCDVIQADGGTRVASITGSCVALVEAIYKIRRQNCLRYNPFKQLVAGISVGICNNELVLDLDYEEDSSAETDMNVVMTEDGNFIEVQGTAEHGVFNQQQMNDLLNLARDGLEKIIQQQKEALQELL